MQKNSKMKKPKRAKCPACKQRDLFYRNGIKVSKLCAACKKAKEQTKKEKTKLTKGFQARQYKTLHAKAWKLMSEWVRSSAANSEGMLSCYTCDKVIHWKEAHSSHFHHGKLDFDTRNLKPCCVGCNKYRHGNLAVYGTRLAKELGAEGMEKLLLDSNTVSYTKDQLEGIILKIMLLVN